MKKILNRISHIGIDENIEELSMRHIILINIIAVFLIGVAWIYLPLTILFLPSNTPLQVTLIFHGIVFFMVLYLNHKKKFLAARLFFGVSAAVFMFFESLFVGPDTGIHYFFLAAIIVPFFIYPRNERRYMYVIVGILVMCYGVLDVYFASFEPLFKIQDPRIILFSSISIKSGVAFIIVAICVYAYMVIAQFEEKLALEKRKADSLLRNILPDKIAERLKGGSGSIADGYEYVSILFADIAGFTELSSITAPEKLVATLNEIFSKFDDLTERYGLEKIKTIGDAYMVAAGIPEPMDDHACRLIELAKDMISEIDELNKKNSLSLGIRIGINSGPVVAGVIGKKKFIYDLWGDSVNIASRMESHGASGQIHITKNTYELVKNKYIFKKRGEIKIKGKGLMETYFYEKDISNMNADTN